MAARGVFGLGHPHEEAEPEDGLGEDFSGREVTCNRCGRGPFTWLHTGLRWRLLGERGKLHDCPGISTDDFG